jgi:hypothetical protein
LIDGGISHIGSHQPVVIEHWRLMHLLGYGVGDLSLADDFETVDGDHIDCLANIESL